MPPQNKDESIFSDGVLEIEEIEGLIDSHVGSSSKNSSTSPKSESSLVVSTMSTIAAVPQRSLWTCAGCMLLLLMAALYSTDSVEIILGTSNQSDVSQKEQSKEVVTSAQVGPSEDDESGTRVVYDPPMDDETKQDLENQWGKWHFTDERTNERPANDYCGDYPHRDIPRNQLPKNAWQADPEYLHGFLQEGLDLVDRAMEAILSEYGKGQDSSDAPFEERAAMFLPIFVEITEETEAANSLEKGGWTTRSSFQGLVRRILHAIMTQDNFTLVLGGHSSAAGHGNHFKQSYTMQFHKIMWPVFHRLGVKLISRNNAQGGLGTIQTALGSGSIYGDEIDILLWDSGMTEKSKGQIELFVRQGLIGGNRVPMVLGGGFDILANLHNKTGADVGEFGLGNFGIPTTRDESHAEELPFAVRYLACEVESQELCHENKYRSTCWINRTDFEPPTKQKKVMGGQASWHPGFRTHQLTGRVLSFWVLMALKEGLKQWQEVDGYALPDSAWHMSGHHASIQSKALALHPLDGFCGNVDSMPARICNTPMQGRTEHTPRFNPEQTSIRSLVRPAGPDAYIPRAEDNVYDGDDVHNDLLDVPDGEVDVLAIVTNNRRLQVNDMSAVNGIGKNAKASQNRMLENTVSNELIVPGLGWEVHTISGDWDCDGTYNKPCGRAASSDCLLYGHHDGRGGLFFDSFSGWLVMDLPNLKSGLILIKLESWWASGAVQRTKGWTSENNSAGLERKLRATQPETEESGGRYLKASAPELCDDFVFEFAIDGQITSMNREEFEARRTLPQRVVELWTLLDDINYRQGTVELAVRMRGCQRHNTFSLTHVYWA